MTSVAVVLLVVLVVWYSSVALRRSRGIVARRGMSIGADLGTLADKPRVRIRTMTSAGSGLVHLVLSPEPEPDGATGPDVDLTVLLGEEEFGYELLRGWERSDSLLAIVRPPDSRLVRLRSIEDLQPLTLRLVEEG